MVLVVQLRIALPNSPGADSASLNGSIAGKLRALVGVAGGVLNRNGERDCLIIYTMIKNNNTRMCICMYNSLTVLHHQVIMLDVQKVLVMGEDELHHDLCRSAAYHPNFGVP